MHTLLERQLKKQYKSLDKVPSEFLIFLENVSKTYDDYDRDYSLIERSLSISSKESQELNAGLRAEAEIARKRNEELERFNRLVVDRELKMIELKKEIERLKAQGS